MSNDQMAGSSVVEQGPVKTPVVGSIPTPPATHGVQHLGDEVSDFIVNADAPYFPGRDYPDRQKWLARRFTPSGKAAVPCALIARNQVNNRHACRAGQFASDLPTAKPMYAGINRAKRALGIEGRRDIVKQRHDFYNRRSDEQARAKG